MKIDRTMIIDLYDIEDWMLDEIVEMVSDFVEGHDGKGVFMTTGLNADE